MKIHLGVVDLPYVNSPRLPSAATLRKKRKAPKEAGGNGITTGDVAEILEAKYHVMEVFADRHEDEIASFVETEMAGALESALQGAPPRNDPLAGAMGAIENSFRKFLDSEEMKDAGVPGVPTKAAIKGINHRLKSKRGARRPSFEDTGLYEASFVAWTDR